MATIKFITRTKKNPARLYVRFSNGRSLNLMKATPLLINPKYFNSQSGKVRQVAEFIEKIAFEASMEGVRSLIIDQYSTDLKKGKQIDSDWLQECIDNHFCSNERVDKTLLINYFDQYIEYIKNKTNERTGQLGASIGTIRKYTTIKHKIEDFQKHSKKKYYLKDVDLNFRSDFMDYLTKKDLLSRNTVGRYLRFLKTVCIQAKNEGYPVSPELDLVKGFKVRTQFIVFNEEDIEKIKKVTITDSELLKAKDWLILGCYLGQRASDLLQLKADSIITRNNRKYVELLQKKTDKRVLIPILKEAQKILSKYNDHFPPSYSKNVGSATAVFNRGIKKICKLAGIDEMTEGERINPLTKRKEGGVYPKYELVSSHICRRSFASIHYGKAPTSVLSSITGHTTERAFLEYIGKSAIDQAEQIFNYLE